LHGSKTLERLISALGKAMGECGVAVDVASAVARIREGELDDISRIGA